MTRQRLREGSIKWETQLSLDSFSQKILKKIQYLAFTDKTKFIKSYVPEKVKIFIEKNFDDELTYFQKKYSVKVDILPSSPFVIPEYSIELLNKSKKIIEKIENKKVIAESKISISNKTADKKDKKNLKKTKKVSKKIKDKKKLRTLWVRKKKKLR